MIKYSYKDKKFIVPFGLGNFEPVYNETAPLEGTQAETTNPASDEQNG